jgi:hypothetical protein
VCARFAVAGAFIATMLVVGACAPASSPTIAGAGTIAFGTAVDTTSMRVVNPGTSFRASEPVGWVARLSAPVNGDSVSVGIFSAGGGNVTISGFGVAIPNPADDVLSHSADNTLGQLGPGTYTVHYVRTSDGTLLASGTVTITP